MVGREPCSSRVCTACALQGSPSVSQNSSARRVRAWTCRGRRGTFLCPWPCTAAGRRPAPQAALLDLRHQAGGWAAQGAELRRCCSVRRPAAAAHLALKLDQGGEGAHELALGALHSARAPSAWGAPAEEPGPAAGCSRRRSWLLHARTLTVKVRPSFLTSTPAGMAMGARPTRLSLHSMRWGSILCSRGAAGALCSRQGLPMKRPDPSAGGPCSAMVAGRRCSPQLSLAKASGSEAGPALWVWSSPAHRPVQRPQNVPAETAGSSRDRPSQGRLCGMLLHPTPPSQPGAHRCPARQAQRALRRRQRACRRAQRVCRAASTPAQAEARPLLLLCWAGTASGHRW